MIGAATDYGPKQPYSWMIFFTVVYIGTSIAFYRFDLGDSALVYANIINLSARIIYALHFCQKFFSSHDASQVLRWRDVSPPWTLVSGLLFSALAINMSETAFRATEIVQRQGRTGIVRRPVLLHVALGVILALCCIAWWGWTARRFLAVPKRWNKVKTA